MAYALMSGPIVWYANRIVSQTNNDEPSPETIDVIGKRFAEMHTNGSPVQFVAIENDDLITRQLSSIKSQLSSEKVCCH